MRTFLIGLSWVALPLTVACGGPSVAEVTQEHVTLTVRAFASDPAVANVGKPDGGIGVARAYLSASAVSLIPCSGAEQIVLDPRGYELVNEPPYSELVTTAVDEFCGLRVDVDPVDESAAEDVPRGSSLYVAGEDAERKPLTLSSSSSFSLLFETDKSQSFGHEPLILGFDVSTWLAGLPLPEDMTDASTQLFEEQLYGSAALYADKNGNGSLDEDERTPLVKVKAPR
jgi:hypothetical protein